MRGPTTKQHDATQPGSAGYIDTAVEYDNYVAERTREQRQPAKEHVKAARLNHPNRCQADLSKSRPEEPICYRMALRGSQYCYFHGGHKGNAGTNTVHLPMFYSKVLTGTLFEYVQQGLDKPVVEQLQVMEELLLYKTTLLPAVALYNAAFNSGNAEAIANATVLIRDGVAGLADLVHTVSKIRANEKGSISIHNLVEITNQLVRIIYDTAPDDVAREIERKVRDKVKIAYSQSEGTTITPDQVDDTILAMDATIARKPVELHATNASNGRNGGNGKH